MSGNDGGGGGGFFSCCCSICGCCPPAVSALLYLWVRSGFSKGSVAGALTFFPPDPPMYRFQRAEGAAGGRDLPDWSDEEDDYEDSDGGGEGAQEEGSGRENGSGVAGGDDPDADLGSIELPRNSSDTSATRERRKEERRNERREERRRSSEEKEEENEDPIAAMTARSNRLRARAKIRARRDAADAKANVCYRFVPDLATLGALSLPAFSGSIDAVKISPKNKKGAGTHVAAVVYRLRKEDCTANTKTLLVSHGNATDVGAMAGIQCVLAKNCRCHVVVYDYSGYGESGGVPTEKATYQDIKSAYEWTLQNVATGKLESNIVLYGQSVGSGPSCYLASKRKDLGGLVLHSPFTSGMRVLTPSRALACLDIFPNINRVAKVNCPVFIMHGREDREVPYAHGVALQEAVPDRFKRPPWWVANRGHNDITDGPGIVEYIQRMDRFVKSLDD